VAWSVARDPEGQRFPIKLEAGIRAVTGLVDG
jgi:hypothetical protein